MAFPPENTEIGTAPSMPTSQPMGHPSANPQSVAPGGRSVYGGRPVAPMAKPFTTSGGDGSVTTQGTSGEVVDTDEAEGVGSIPVSPMGGVPTPFSGV